MEDENMHVVTVRFAQKPGVRGGFLPPMLDNAHLSRQPDPGCQRFDVCESPNVADELFLNELCDDELAFANNKKQPHNLELSAKTEAMIKNKAISTFSLIQEGTTL